jgi:SpoVK/Ycf46/Vps4 family AAA+-type ATPase
MVEEFAKGAIKFYKYNGIPKKKLFGYRGQLAAGLGLALFVAQGGANETLVIGYPGTGKSVFPFALARELNCKMGQKFSLLMVDCDAIVGEEVEKELAKAVAMAENCPPTIIAYDEFEGIATPIDSEVQTTASAILSRRLRKYASERDESKREKSLLLCISNFPNLIDMSVARNFDSVIYFGPDEQRAIEEILREHLGIRDSKNVARLLRKKKKDLGFATLGHNVLQACKKIDKKKLVGMTDEKIAEQLLMMAGPGATLKKTQQYEEDCKEWISLASKQEKWWQQRGKEMANSLKSK